MHALILDDEPLILSLLERMLSLRGYDVVAYANPTVCPLYSDMDCPCSSESPCPDVILADLKMPYVSGAEFIDHLRRKGCTCRNIALISGSWSAEDEMPSPLQGVSFFAKPFCIEKLESWLGTAERLMVR
ncbi:MAG: response regulator [bacterium]